jgi:hypothetical protein
MSAVFCYGTLTEGHIVLLSIRQSYQNQWVTCFFRVVALILLTNVQDFCTRVQFSKVMT